MTKAPWDKLNVLLLGVTGGIASGKTAVAHMLEELGAPIIDFDVLARQVVEPGEPALKDIVDYFGKQVLQEDGSLDRKRLSNIVFRDMEKRKKLESFTHPRISEEFVRHVNKIAEKTPGAIIQVVIPLLIELNMQHRFHKLMVVYIPEELQIERLTERDGISRKEATTILKAQMPIEEKVRYADYVIHNERSLEETRRQVEDVWQTLKNVQKQKGESKPI
jgi:dephospho-CoA kinase